MGKARDNTLLAAVRVALTHATRYNSGDVVAPAAVLSTDADGQWWPVVERLRPMWPGTADIGRL
jgi:hypothetical protein